MSGLVNYYGIYHPRWDSFFYFNALANKLDWTPSIHDAFKGNSHILLFDWREVNELDRLTNELTAILPAYHWKGNMVEEFTGALWVDIVIDTVDRGTKVYDLGDDVKSVDYFNSFPIEFYYA